MEQTTPKKTDIRSTVVSIGNKPIMSLLADTFKAFRKFWWLSILLGAILFSVFFYRGYSKVHVTYTASASFYITVQTAGYTYAHVYSAGTAEQMAETFPYLLQSQILQDVVKEDLGVTYLNGTISASGVESTNLFTLSVTSDNAQDAYDILLSVMENYPEVAEYVIGNTKLELLSQPVVPEGVVVTDNFISRAVWMGVAGIGVGIVLIVVTVLFRRTICTVEDFEQELNVKCIAIVPKIVKKKRSKKNRSQPLLVSTQRDGYALMEPMRGLRTRVISQMEEKDAHVLLVTSTKAGEGKTTIAANLALSLAKKGTSVVLVDCDLRNPHVSEAFGMEQPQAGLAQLLQGEAKLLDVMQMGKKYRLRLIMGKGQEKNPLMLIGSEEMKKLIQRLRKTNKYVILDTPPCGMFADASRLASCSDCILYVVGQDDASTTSIIDAIQGLSYANKPIIGAVLNKAEYGIVGYGYGYGRGYGYGYGSYYYKRGYGSYYSRGGDYGKYGKYGKYGYGIYAGTKDGKEELIIRDEEQAPAPKDDGIK
ncbi:MAG: polysaccharide biosynthesis tyrosine autokinase [Clostridia bacterium]|nr:polysaccharide biosynthesis tyrosine autokinase [Clostridia bacterium]